LQRRAAYQALCMAAFGVFWTSVALRLAEAPFTLGQKGMALFAFAGAAGAVIAPVAGRWGDKGRTRSGTIFAHLGIILAMILAEIGGEFWDRLSGSPTLALALLVAAAILLDLGVIADQTLGRRAINLLRPEARGRINGLFTGLFFLGAGAGSALSGVALVEAGWRGICVLGLVFALLALGLVFTESRK
jgi:MFS family permease